MPACSAKRLAANRANARKSTGPRSAAGKRRAAMNAVSHGYFCQDAVLPGEDPALFAATRRQYLELYRPQCLPELAIVDRLVMANWKLRRLGAAERHAVELKIASLGAKADEAAARLTALAADDLDDHRRYVRDPAFTERQLAAEEEQFANVVARRDDARAVSIALKIAGGPAAVAHVLAEPGGGTIERINRLQHRLQAEISRCHKELRDLRDELSAWAERPASPFLVEGEEEPEEEESIADDEPEEPVADAIASPATAETSNVRNEPTAETGEAVPATPDAPPGPGSDPPVA